MVTSHCITGWACPSDSRLSPSPVCLSVSYFMEGRDPAQLIYRWNQVLDPSLKRGFWTKEEDQVDGGRGLDKTHLLFVAVTGSFITPTKLIYLILIPSVSGSHTRH